MKFFRSIVVLGLLALASCATSHEPRATPETVSITYRVLTGKEQDLQNLLATAWDTYQEQHMVHSQPHILVQVKEDAGKSHFVETFTWNSPDVPDNAPDPVKKLWTQMMALCEKRDGHDGLEITTEDLILPSASE